MRQFFALFILMVISISASSQKIKYESSLEAAKSMAIIQNKPVAILITIEPPVYSPNFMSGLNDPEVIKMFNNDFINYKADRSDSAASAKIIKEYSIYRFPSFLFLDSKGRFLFTDIAFLSRPQPILQIAQRAREEIKQKPLAEYDKAYAAGEDDPAFLKEYIVKREKAGINGNAELIEKYVIGLKVSDFFKYDEVLFILNTGPVVDGIAYKLANLDRQLIDSIFKTEPLHFRVAINNAIIKNSLNSAISAKNYNRAIAAANYASRSWSNNSFEGQKNWMNCLMNYFKGVNDTAKYLSQASNYYEQYYMRLTVDSVRRRDSLNFVTARKNAQEISRIAVNESTTIRAFSFTYKKDSFATELNNAAWSFYQMASGKSEYLLKAMQWSRRSIELSPKPAFYDTYAHLLYSLKLFDEAESMEKKAIELASTARLETKQYQQEFEKIKKRSI